MLIWSARTQNCQSKPLSYSRRFKAPFAFAAFFLLSLTFSFSFSFCLFCFVLVDSRMTTNTVICFNGMMRLLRAQLIKIVALAVRFSFFDFPLIFIVCCLLFSPFRRPLDMIVSLSLRQSSLAKLISELFEFSMVAIMIQRCTSPSLLCFRFLCLSSSLGSSRFRSSSSSSLSLLLWAALHDHLFLAVV